MKRVMLFHDFQEPEDQGFDRTRSRYLLSARLIRATVETAIKKKLDFESFHDNPSIHSKIEITVDDGGYSALSFAEYLKAKNIRGRFFIVTDRINQKHFLSKDEIKYIRALGHIVGSHSHTHPNPFCFLSYENLKVEILKSRSILEDLLCEEIRSFAVPGGEIRSSTMRWLSRSELGLNQIYTSTPYKGVYKRINNCEFIGRLCIERKMSMARIIRYFCGKGWFANRLDYQVRRLRREIIYRCTKTA